MLVEQLGSLKMVSFDIKGKVAIVTGGASGLGFQYVLELLKKQAKGVVMADISEDLGSKAVDQLEREFGPTKAIFIKTDVTDYGQFEDKVAIVTGGASGLGFQYALELLTKQAKGVVLADISAEVGSKAVDQLEKEFGPTKAIFIKTDVTDYGQFEDVFKKTISVFQSVDILINNAGVFNDLHWQQEIAINLNGTIHGVLLGLENYIKNFKSGDEGLIVNISSVAGISPFPLMPLYVATKFAIQGLTLSWGSPDHYNRTRVRVVGICPGVTSTPLLKEVENRTLGPDYKKLISSLYSVPGQNPEEIAPHAMTVIEKAPSGTIWVLEGGEPPYQFALPDRFTQPKVVLR